MQIFLKVSLEHFGTVRFFRKLWGKVHGFDKLSKGVQHKMMKEMDPYYSVQFIVTIITTTVLALFMSALPDTWDTYGIAAFIWIDL